MQLFKGFGACYAKPQVDKSVAAYADFAAAEGLTPTQLALGFVYSHWCVGSVILGATSLPQLGEDLRTCRTVLSPRVLAAIENIHLTIPNPTP
jgi:aryl-alcohol dehydrogenase-like predicted oxidoreductase